MAFVAAAVDSRFVTFLLEMNGAMIVCRVIQPSPNSIVWAMVAFLLVAAEFPLMHCKSPTKMKNISEKIPLFFHFYKGLYVLTAAHGTLSISPSVIAAAGARNWYGKIELQCVV